MGRDGHPPKKLKLASSCRAAASIRQCKQPESHLPEDVPLVPSSTLRYCFETRHTSTVPCTHIICTRIKLKP